jgi:hypothetical protein
MLSSKFYPFKLGLGCGLFGSGMDGDMAAWRRLTAAASDCLWGRALGDATSGFRFTCTLSYWASLVSLARVAKHFTR